MKRPPLPDGDPDLRWLERVSTWVVVAILFAAILLTLLYISLT